MAWRSQYYIYDGLMSFVFILRKVKMTCPSKGSESCQCIYNEDLFSMFT